jgi:hypothetical protein
MSLLKVYHPEIVDSDTGVRLQAIYEVDGNKDVIWYEVDEIYRRYLTEDRVDAFFVVLLLYALKNGHDIVLMAPISPRLYYTTKKYLADVIAASNEFKKIKILCTELAKNPVQNIGAVGTGLSCGIDSFSTIWEHMKDSDLESFKVNYFTFFNVGSHGSFGGEKARELFIKRSIIAKQCAEELGGELIIVDSNLSEVLNMSFLETHTFRNISAVLILQKLFKVYYYSSSVPVKHFRIYKQTPEYYDVFNMSMLCTESISFFSSDAFKTRVDKTKTIADFEPALRYLNVCVKEEHNCGACFKCLRTLLTLEIAGKINKFESVFNLNSYYRNKSRYLAQVLAYHNNDLYLNEIYDEILLNNFKIPIYSRMAAQYLIFKKTIISIKKSALRRVNSDKKLNLYNGGNKYEK